MQDREILRQLANEIAIIAEDSSQEQNRIAWQKLNDLDKAHQPMFLVFQEPWHEINFDGSLTLKCQDSYLRRVENEMRQTIFRWKHFRGNMVVDGFWNVDIVSNFDCECGIKIEEDLINQDNRGGISSHSYTTQFQSLDDLEKIKFVEVNYNKIETMRRFNLLDECFGDILPIKIRKIGSIWYAPWDKISMWYDPMELLMDLMLKPELMHGIVNRYTEAMLYQLDQLEAQNLLSLCNNNSIIGSGGLGYSNEFKISENKIQANQLWGSAAAQIFSEISPDMHEEFALQYERRWLERFNLSYYGCCEPLHNKLEILKSVKNLRKISCSPWANIEKTVERTNGNYVLSIKPNPAHVATPKMDHAEIKRYFTKIINELQGAPCEFIFKDISTCQNDVSRISDWLRIGQEVAAENSRG